MNTRERIKKILKERILILDGAIGTELYKHGLPSGASPEIFCLKNPAALQAIHSAYRNAGADIIYSCTFGANRLKLKQYGNYDVVKTNRRLVEITRRAIGKGALIAGDIGPSGHFIKPFGELEFEAAVDIFKEQVKGLLLGGVDLLVIETMIDIQEARAALLAVKESTDKFVMATLTFNQDGRTLNGNDAVSALITLQSLGADALGCNCSTGPGDMLKLIRRMKPYATVPLIAKPNAGMPRVKGDKAVYGLQPLNFAKSMLSLTRAGANLVGGCCGTTPGHIAQLKRRAGRIKPLLPVRKSIGALSSARKNLILEGDKPPYIIGEQINPTGRKKMQQDLLAGRFSRLRDLAAQQERNGASLLDVNVGVAKLNEKKAMHKAVSILCAATTLPLCIDSSSPEVIASALRLYPGRALINSISAQKKKLHQLLPIAQKYGAMFIALALDDKGIPKTLGRRKAIIKGIIRSAAKSGFSKSDILVDCLAMSMASNPEYARQSLATASWSKKKLGCKTVIGLSNISFGLPNRPWINAAFLAMAMKNGLSLAIADPQVLKLTRHKIVKRIIAKRYRNFANLVDDFLKMGQRGLGKARAKGLSLKEKIYCAVLEGNKGMIIGLVRQGLSQGLNAYAMIEEIIVPAIIKVGDLFDKKEYFLPQLISAAETVKKAFLYLKPRLQRGKGRVGEKNLVILATVKGDIHDIGKNIVKLLLESNGFEVLDLGKDVSAEKIILSIKRFHPHVVGLSALMTTTMINMKEVIELAKKEKLKAKFMAGGAVLNAPYARSIGAEYARDASAAVQLARRLSP